eukprot:scaffold119047_cov37-Tisochrysis_lutea.AAC.5
MPKPSSVDLLHREVCPITARIGVEQRYCRLHAVERILRRAQDAQGGQSWLHSPSACSGR